MTEEEKQDAILQLKVLKFMQEEFEKELVENTKYALFPIDTLQVCNHEWRIYNGFTDSYSYCVKCDLKQ